MNYRFLLKPRWILFLLVGAALAVLFTSLGFWQLIRLEQRKARNQLIQSRMAEAPQGLLELASSYTSEVSAFDKNSIAYRQAVITGHYDSASEVLLRSTKNYDGQPGYYLLTPLVLQDKQAVLVMRGWVPFELNRPPIKEALPPEGDIKISGIIELERKPSTSLLTPKDPPGKLAITAYIDTVRLEQQMPYDLLPFYISLENQTPAQSLDLPKPMPKLEFTDGPHLGYAIQWFSFTFIGVLGYLLLIIKTAREARDNDA
jgi:surfeit locus 1 family protein